MIAAKTQPEVQTIRRAFKFRCYPNKGTRRRAYCKMRLLAGLWNACVGERDEARKEFRARLGRLVFLEEVRLSREMTEKDLKALRQAANKAIKWPSAYSQYTLMRKREHSEYADCDAQMCQDVLTKVDGSDKSFLALWKKGDRNARPPRFKGMHRCLTYRQSGWRLDGNNLYLSHVGIFHVRLHRPIEGKVKTVSVTEKNGKWYACFSCQIERISGDVGSPVASKSFVPRDLRQDYTLSGGSDLNLRGRPNHHTSPIGGSSSEKSGRPNHSDRTPTAWRDGSSSEKSGRPNEGGSDPLGLPDESSPEKAGTCTIEFIFADGLFLRDSDGREIEHPEFYWTEIAKVRRLSRSLSRKKPGSRNRRKARRAMANWHERIANKRDYFLWHWARFYVTSYRQIIVPKWPLSKQIHYAVTSRQAMKLCDGAYARFLTMLRQKCEEFGTEFVERKDDRWEKEVIELTEVARLEAGSHLLWNAKRLASRGSRVLPESLRKEYERAVTLSI
jgi:transposase